MPSESCTPGSSHGPEMNMELVWGNVNLELGQTVSHSSFHKESLLVGLPRIAIDSGGASSQKEHFVGIGAFKAAIIIRNHREEVVVGARQPWNHGRSIHSYIQGIDVVPAGMTPVDFVARQSATFTGIPGQPDRKRFCISGVRCNINSEERCDNNKSQKQGNNNLLKRQEITVPGKVRVFGFQPSTSLPWCISHQGEASTVFSNSG